jgi:hypothetical protein
LIAIFFDDTTMFNGLDLDNAPLANSGTIVLKRRKVCLSADAKPIIFCFLQGQVVDNFLPQGALTAAAKLASCCVNTVAKI